MCEDERGFTEDIWKKMADMDWMAMRIPESYGGIGMDLMDLNMVLEEMGRTVFPGPFFSTILLAAEAIVASGSDAQKDRYLPGIADGNLRGTLAMNEPDGGADTDYIQMAARAEGDDFVLTGTKVSVPDAHVADVLVCAARTESGNDPNKGITLFLVDPREPGVSVSPLPTMDSTRKLCVVEFKGVRLGKESILGERHRGWGTLKQVLQRAQIGLSAECVGGAERVMEIATDYGQDPYSIQSAYRHLPSREAPLCPDVPGSGKCALAIILGGMGPGLWRRKESGCCGIRSQILLL